jgi:RNase P/RNase MRP subunit POP5
VLATGGWVQGVGTGTSDSNPYWLSRGEFVVREAVARSAPWLPTFNLTGQVPANDNGVTASEIRALRQEVAELRAALVRATVAGAEHVAGRVDGVSGSLREVAREMKLKAG